MGKFNVNQSKQTEFEVDNNLYGFHSQQNDSDTKEPQNLYEYSTLNAQETEQVDNPMYDSGHQEMQTNNTAYSSSNAQAGTLQTDATYSNVNFDGREVQMDTNPEYTYCKH